MSNTARNLLIGLLVALLVCGLAFYLSFQSFQLAAWLQGRAWLISIGVLLLVGVGVYAWRRR